MSYYNSFCNLKIINFHAFVNITISTIIDWWTLLMLISQMCFLAESTHCMLVNTSMYNMTLKSLYTVFYLIYFFR